MSPYAADDWVWEQRHGRTKGGNGEWGQASWSEWGGKGSQDWPTDLYLADVPAEWGEDQLLRLHRQAGPNHPAFSGVKWLPPKYGSHTRSIILNYSSHAEAATAVEVLRDRRVNGRAGPTTIVARFADPPKQQGLGVPLTLSLRVRSSKTWRTGEVAAVNVNGDARRFLICFDDGEEAVKEAHSFETEDGRPLAEASRSVTAFVGLRVRNSVSWRLGMVVGLSSRRPGVIRVLFDEGNEGERDMAKFETEDGRPLVLPPGAARENEEWSDWPRRDDGMNGDSQGGDSRQHPRSPGGGTRRQRPPHDSTSGWDPESVTAVAKPTDLYVSEV